MTVTRGLPLLLLDVDGVLSPYAAPGCPPGYTEHEFFPGEDPGPHLHRARAMAGGTGDQLPARVGDRVNSQK